MRILFISPVAPSPAIDGCSVTVSEVVRALRRRHDVTLAYFGVRPPGSGGVDHLRSDSDRHSGGGPHPRGTQVDLQLAPRPKRLAMRPPYLFELLGGLPLSVFPFRGRESKDQVRRLIDGNHFDAVIAYMLHVAELVPTKMPRTRTCIIIQDVVHHAISQHRTFESNWLRRAYASLNVRLLRRYELQEYGRFDARTVISSSEKAHAAELGIDDAIVIPNGVDLEYFRRSTPIADAKDLVYLGNMAAGRNEEAAWIAATQVLPLIRARLPRARLVVAGAAPSDRIRSLANVDRNVVVTGLVDDIRPYLERARAFLVPQSVGTGIKTAVLHAMAMEAPVVTSAAGVQGISGVDGRDYLVCSKIEEFADSALSLLGDAARAQRIGESGREVIAERYSWDAYASRIGDLLSEPEMRRTS